MIPYDPAARLRELTEACTRVGSNLLELEADSTVGMLDAAVLCGVTDARWSAARQSLARLFTVHGALREVVEEAGRVDSRIWTLTGSRVEQLRSLLDGPSIVVSDSALELADRTLLSDSRAVVRCTPDELIARMSTDFASVKAVVVDVASVWNDMIPRLRDARRWSLELSDFADQLGVERPRDLDEAAGVLRVLSETVLSDPLSADRACADQIHAMLARVADDLAEVRGLRESWNERMSAARSLLDEARSAVAECEDAVQHATSRIALDQVMQPVALPGHATDELDRIAESADDLWATAPRLAEWRRQVQECRDEALDTTRRCRSTIAERDDLRARLDGYRAKAAALGLLEDPMVVSAYERARSILYTAPTDVAAARDIVVAYQNTLSVGRNLRGDA